MFRKKKAVSEESQVDMTPMLDIVFILLIFFVATTAFIKSDTVEILQPSSSNKCNAPDCTPQMSVIQIYMDNTVAYNDRLIDIEAIQSNIEASLGENPRHGFILKISPESSNKSLIRAVDQAKLAGVHNLTVSRL